MWGVYRYIPKHLVYFSDRRFCMFDLRVASESVPTSTDVLATAPQLRPSLTLILLLVHDQRSCLLNYCHAFLRVNPAVFHSVAPSPSRGVLLKIFSKTHSSVNCVAPFRCTFMSPWFNSRDAKIAARRKFPATPVWFAAIHIRS